MPKQTTIERDIELKLAGKPLPLPTIENILRENTLSQLAIVSVGQGWTATLSASGGGISSDQAQTIPDALGLLERKLEALAVLFQRRSS